MIYHMRVVEDGDAATEQGRRIGTTAAPDFERRLFHFDRHQDAASVHTCHHPNTGLALIVARECQILTAPTTLLFEAFLGVNALIAEP